MSSCSRRPKIMCKGMAAYTPRFTFASCLSAAGHLGGHERAVDRGASQLLDRPAKFALRHMGRCRVNHGMLASSMNSGHFGPVSAQAKRDENYLGLTLHPLASIFQGIGYELCARGVRCKVSRFDAPDLQVRCRYGPPTVRKARAA